MFVIADTPSCLEKYMKRSPWAPYKTSISLLSSCRRRRGLGWKPTTKEPEAEIGMPMENHDPASVGQQRLRQRYQVASKPFAGRIGGNQEFVASPDSEELQKQPDAVSRCPAQLSST